MVCKFGDACRPPTRVWDHYVRLNGRVNLVMVYGCGGSRMYNARCLVERVPIWLLFTDNMKCGRIYVDISWGWANDNLSISKINMLRQVTIVHLMVRRRI